MNVRRQAVAQDLWPWAGILLLLVLTLALVPWLKDVLSWRFPAMLWGLAGAPLVLAVHRVGAMREALHDQRFATSARLAQLIVGRSAPLRALHGALRAAAWSLLIMALSGPQYGSRSETLKKRGVDLVIALDFSKSMLARDVLPDRIARAKAELGDFFRQLTGDRVGLVAFAGDTLEFPMTTDYAALDLFLSELTPNDMPIGGTAVGRALTAAQRLLERSGGEGGGKDVEQTASRSRVVLLMTDGEDHDGDPEAAAAELAKRGIRLYTVGIGTAIGEPIPTYADDGTWTGYLRDEQGHPVTTALTASNERVLRAIAEQTGGKYLRAERGGVGMAQIREALRAMKQQELEARRITIHEDRYALLLLPGFLLLLLDTILPEAARPRPGRRRLGPLWGRTRRRSNARVLAEGAHGTQDPGAP